MIEKRIDTDLYTIEFKKPEAIDAIMIETIGRNDKRGTAFSHSVYGKGSDLLELLGNATKRIVTTMLQSGVDKNDCVNKLAELGAKATFEGFIEFLGKADNIVEQFEKELVSEEKGDLN